jgi:hypothetical protein
MTDKDNHFRDNGIIPIEIRHSTDKESFITRYKNRG